jgi:hypothetical protein
MKQGDIYNESWRHLSFSKTEVKSEKMWEMPRWVNDANKVGQLKVTVSKMSKHQYMASCDCGCKAQTESSFIKNGRGKEKRSIFLILNFYSYRHRKPKPIWTKFQ